MIIDSHAHLDIQDFDNDRTDVINRAVTGGLTNIITIGIDAGSSLRALELAREHLNSGGVLGVWSYAESSPFSEALGAVFGEVRIEPVTALNTLIDEEQTDWLFFVRN